MSWLGNVRTLPKLLVLIGLLAVVAIVITVMASQSLKSMSDAAAEMDNAAETALLVARMNQNVLASSRSEYRMALDPRPDNVREAAKRGEEEHKMFHERFTDLSKRASAQMQAKLDELQQSFAAYDKAYDQTVAAAGEAKDVQITADMELVKKVALQNREIGEKIRGILRELADRLANDIDRNAKAAAELYISTRNFMIAFAGGGILVGGLLGFLLAQYGVVRPVRAIVAVLQKLAGGQYDIEVVGVDRKDEVGEVAKTALVFKQNGLEKQRMEREQEQAKAQAELEKRAMLERMAGNFEQAVGGVIQSVASSASQLRASSETMSATTEETSRQATAVAAASEQASVNVQTVASAAEELASSVREIGRQVVQSSRIADRAVSEADRTNAKVQELAEGASRIGDVVKLISDIAAQTNLLALNATIEAARAGEAGKGFAVVASEVKALANQTARATQDIASQIGSIQSATGESVQAIDEIGKTIRSINEIAAAIAAAVEEQEAATQEIARNVQQASAGTSEVSANIGGVTRAAADAGAATSQVMGAAEELNRHSDLLRSEVGKFLASVRAA